jgi:hypothetical protein
MMKRDAVCFLLLLLFLGCSPPPVAAATPGQYDQALGQVQAALAAQAEAVTARVVPSNEAPSLVARRVLGPIHALERPGHAPAPANAAPLIAAISAAEALHDSDSKATALEAVGTQIAVLRADLARAGGAPDGAAVVRSARAVLARPEYGSDPLPPPSLAERLAAWLDRVFAPRPQPNQKPLNLPHVNPNVILGILIAVAAAAFAVLVAVIVQAIGRRGVRAKPLALDAEEATLVQSRDNDSLLALAEQQAGLGDYRRAFRLVYLAALIALDTGGTLRFDRSRTNWEYLRALRAAGRADVYAALTPLTREFDQVWYGLAPADAGQYARALAQYHALQPASKSPAPVMQGASA